MPNLTPRDYHCLDPHLQAVTSSMISLNKDAVREYNEQVAEVLRVKMIPAMERADPLFKCLYRRLYYSGSTFEKLRITTPNEFDINVELVIPSNNIQILATDYPGFVQVKVPNFDPNKLKRVLKSYDDFSVGEQRLKRWLNDAGLLKREHVLQWMQSVVDKALREVMINHVEIRRSTSGPAITLNVKSRYPGRGPMDYSVDLVPVFIFDRDYWPKAPVRPPPVPGQVSWCVVPKAPGYVPPETHWRCSFYDVEKNMMNGMNGMKHIIKLMKLLRDSQNWNGISSYYIKTVFMWEMEMRDKEFWCQSIGYLFVHMLKRFVYFLKERKAIPFYWDKRHSLISGLRPEAVQHIGNRMEDLIRNIERRLPENPGFVKTCFTSRPSPPLSSVPPSAPLQPRIREVTEPPRPGTAYVAPRQQQQLVADNGVGLGGILGAGLAVGALAALGAGLFMGLARRRQ